MGAVSVDVELLLELVEIDGALRARGLEERLRLEERRLSLIRRISPPQRAAYSTLTGAGLKPVIVPVRDGRCGACTHLLGAAAKNKLARRKELPRCANCHRLLYVDARASRRRVAVVDPGRRLRAAVRVELAGERWDLTAVTSTRRWRSELARGIGAAIVDESGFDLLPELAGVPRVLVSSSGRAQDLVAKGFGVAVVPWPWTPGTIVRVLDRLEM